MISFEYAQQDNMKRNYFKAIGAQLTLDGGLSCRCKLQSLFYYIGFFQVLSSLIKPQSLITTLAKSACNVPQATTRDGKGKKGLAGNTLGTGGVIGMAMKKALICINAF